MAITVPIRDSYWLNADQLLAGEYPGAPDEAAARDKVAQFIDAGIRSFIDLTEEADWLSPYEHLLKDLARERGLDVRYHRVGIRDLDVPTPEVMTRVLALIRAEIAAGRPVYVHCWGGIGRTGTVAGCWLVEEGLDADAAIARIAELRKGTSDSHRRSPETSEQCSFIRTWRRSR